MNPHQDSSLVVCGVLLGCMVMLGVETEARAGTDTITKEARETLEATKAYTAQQKEAFQQKVHEELSAVQRQISALRDKTRDVSAGARADLQESITELEKKKETVKEKLATLRNATDDKWNTVKSGVDAALDEVKHSYRKALSRLP